VDAHAIQDHSANAWCDVRGILRIGRAHHGACGLQPGAQYRLAFVTSTTRTAFDGNATVYNSTVTTRANTVPQLVALGTTWKAIVSTRGNAGGENPVPGITAWDNTATNPSVSVGVPVYDLAGNLLATNNADMWDENGLLDGIHYIENGTTSPNNIGLVWTGIDAPYPNAQAHALGNSTAWVGINVMGGDTWWASYNSSESFSNSHPIYGISGIITVVPEPSTYALAAFGVIGLLACRRRIRCR
jgi:hypothetical protein